MKKENRKIKKILFVCTGNSCRSVMAEGLLKRALRDKGNDYIEVYSAGISAIGGFTPTDKTVKVMKDDGIDVSGYKTSKLTPEMINDADLILAMDKIHIDKVLNYVPEAGYKTHFLKKYVDRKERNSGFSIPDPIGKPLEVYERVFGMIKECIQELTQRL